MYFTRSRFAFLFSLCAGIQRVAVRSLTADTVRTTRNASITACSQSLIQFRSISLIRALILPFVQCFVFVFFRIVSQTVCFMFIHIICIRVAVEYRRLDTINLCWYTSVPLPCHCLSHLHQQFLFLCSSVALYSHCTPTSVNPTTATWTTTTM